jgi:hypothetical protein
MAPVSLNHAFGIGALLTTRDSWLPREIEQIGAQRAGGMFSNALQNIDRLLAAGKRTVMS